jgi:hypothetical protein
VQAKALGGSVSGGATFQNASGTTMSAQDIAATMTADVWGGDTTADRKSWPDTIKTPDDWAVIGYSGVHSTIDLLPADLQTQVNDVWRAQGRTAKSVLEQPQPWTADVVQTVATDGLLLGQVNCWENFKIGSLVAYTGPRGNQPSWPALGNASAEFLEHYDKFLPISSFCLPVKKGDGALFRAPNLLDNVDLKPSGSSVNFIPIGSNGDSYLGDGIDMESDSSTITLKGDGFIICTLETAANGERGMVVLRKPSTDDAANRLAAISVHWWQSAQERAQSFCIPVSRSLGQVELSVTSTSGNPKVKVRGIPLTNASFGEIEERNFNTTYTASESDGFLIGWLESPNETRGYILAQSAATPEGLNGTLAGASAHNYDGTDIITPYGTTTLPVRQGMLYRAQFGIGWDPNHRMTSRLYWVPLKA